MILKYLQRIMNLRNSSRFYCDSKKFLDISINDEIITLTMKRPPVNSLNLDFLEELSETFSELERNKPRGVILTSFSNKVFSAGLDFVEIYKPDPARLKTFWKCLQEMMIKLYGYSYPTVAIINGHAPAGGCLLALCCEYRIMVDNFTIGPNESKVGIMVPLWFILIMQSTIGLRLTELAVTTGQLFKTNEALEIGLVDEIAVDKAEAMDKAVTFLRRCDMINPVARTFTKNYLRGMNIAVIKAILEKDLKDSTFMIMQPEVQQSIEYYVTKIKDKK